MSDIANLVVAIATLVSAIGAVALGIINRKKISDVHISIDGRMDELLRLNKASSHAEGVIEGREGSGDGT